MQEAGIPDNYIKLVEMGSRWYDPELGRFIQGDSIIPQLGNPQTLNRYSYVNNSPLNFVDPSGHAPQQPGDSDDTEGDCTTEWCWENRWYRAHGYVWSNGREDWVLKGNPVKYYDKGIAREALGEAGVCPTEDFSLEQLTVIGQAVHDLALKIGDGDLFEGQKTLKKSYMFVRFTYSENGTQQHDTYTRYAAITLDWHVIELTAGVFGCRDCGDDWSEGVIVHELAHVINYNNKIRTGFWPWETQRFSQGMPAGGMISRYSQRSREEYWAEAVAIWVYPDFKKHSSYPERFDDLNPLQVDYIQRTLRGWGW